MVGISVAAEEVSAVSCPRLTLLLGSADRSVEAIKLGGMCCMADRPNEMQCCEVGHNTQTQHMQSKSIVK
jgi:hypothetical protein